MLGPMGLRRGHRSGRWMNPNRIRRCIVEPSRYSLAIMDKTVIVARISSRSAGGGPWWSCGSVRFMLDDLRIVCAPPSVGRRRYCSQIAYDAERDSRSAGLAVTPAVRVSSGRYGHWRRCRGVPGGGGVLGTRPGTPNPQIYSNRGPRGPLQGHFW